MNNEIGRKITSLTLMTIMFAGGLAVPGVMPSANAATDNLFVSAENSLFANSVAGPMVVEVVVNDPNLNQIDEAESEPDVTVNGKDLRMVQATDGNWYAYFASRNMANAADGQVEINGTSLDFGVGCTAASAPGIGYTDSSGVYFQLGVGGAQNGALGTCTNFGAVSSSVKADNDTMNVIRENKTATRPGSNGILPGQVDVAQNEFPAIQLFTFTVDGTIEVKYNKGGSPQQINLTYLDDADQYASWSADRTKYPQDSSVHLTVTDLMLNIDPTDEDSWTFATNATTGATASTFGTPANGTRAYYQIFDENGAYGGLYSGGATIRAIAGATPAPAINMGSLNFNDNGVLIINADPLGTGTAVLTFADNDDQILTTEVNGQWIVNGTHYFFNGTLGSGAQPVTLTETQSNSGIFRNTDEGDVSNIRITENALRGTTGTIDYNDTAGSVLVANFFGTLTIDVDALGGEWNSGEEVTVTLVDGDQNKNSLVDEDLDLNNADIPIIPSVQIGSPITFETLDVVEYGNGTDHVGDPLDHATVRADVDGGNAGGATLSVDDFSQRANFGVTGSGVYNQGDALLNFTYTTTSDDLRDFLADGTTASIYHYFNYDLRSFETNGTDIFAGANINITLTNATIQAAGVSNVVAIDTAAEDFQGLIDISGVVWNGDDTGGATGTDPIQVLFNFTNIGVQTLNEGNYTAVVDFFRFGQSVDGKLPQNRYNDAIYRLELEETGDNTATFVGSMEYIMLNQINVNKTATYTGGLDPITDAIKLIVHNDLTDEDSVRINYLDLGGDGVETQIADQVEAPTHSGVVSFDSSTYKIADTVTITLEDQDLNTDVETIDIFTVAGSTETTDQVGATGYGQNSENENFGRLLDVTFDDEIWQRSTVKGCATAGSPDDGLGATGFTLVETGVDTGIFTGDFQVPSTYCAADGTTPSATGTDMEVNYVDYRDASGEVIEVGDGAGIRANTGSVSLDRTVYPVPWGTLDDISGGSTGTTSTGGYSVFPVHLTGLVGTDVDTAGETLGDGDLTIHVRINDPDYDVSATGEDKIKERATESDGTNTRANGGGPLRITVSRGADAVVLATAGGPSATTVGGAAGKITVGTVATAVTRELGPITEIAPDAGIFELDLPIRYTDGPSSTSCPDTDLYKSATNSTYGTNEDETIRFDTALASSEGDYCILQGDILTVEYRDPTDASGDPNTVTDSATFDLRNGVLQSDKSVYIIGSDMILTLIEPDFDLDNDEAETYDLDLIEWDSDAATTTMGNLADTVVGTGTAAAFDPEPSNLRETGDSTGIFQIVIEIPAALGGDNLERGEEVVLEYTDWGPSGADYVGDEDEDINLTIFTSNFGATVELDQKVYTWTDKVYITIVAPDHNFDSNLIDEIGNTALDPIKVSTRGHSIDNYRLVETGTDTGIFTGEVILTGFAHDADGDGTNDAPTQTPATSADGTGPTDGYLASDDDDGITVSFEFSEDETVVGSALIRWNIGEVQWLEASYPASGTGVVRVVDPDMNLDPESVNNFDVDVWSDSDAGGIDLTVTETNEATGIFEGTVFFTTTDESSGHRLRVAEGDTITAEYQDNTLPDPYTTADELDIAGTSIIGTVVPPLERAPAANARVVDAFGNALGSVSVDQQVQITADLANGQDREQSFAYLVQVQDGNGVTVSLAWITGSLSAGQSFSPALSWIPDASGSYTATVFVWESVDNPTALSPPVSVTITVS